MWILSLIPVVLFIWFFIDYKFYMIFVTEELELEPKPELPPCLPINTNNHIPNRHERGWITTHAELG